MRATSYLPGFFRMNRLQKRGVKLIRGLFCAGLAGLFLFVFIQGLGAQEVIGNREIAIKVKPNIIALPGNQVAKVPLSAARIRSTDLRKLNKKYNALSIEKLFRLNGKNKEITTGLISREKKWQDEAGIDLKGLLTKETKKEMLAQGKEVASAKDTFLIQFAYGVNIGKLLGDYRALEIVVYADEVRRVK